MRNVRKVRDFLHGDIVVFGDIANIAKIVMQIFIEPAWNAEERKKRTWHSCTAELPRKKIRLAGDAKRNRKGDLSHKFILLVYTHSLKNSSLKMSLSDSR